MNLLLRHLAQKWLGIYSDQCRRCKRWFFSDKRHGGDFGIFVGFNSSYIACSPEEWAKWANKPTQILGRYHPAELTPPLRFACGYGSSYDLDIYRLVRPINEDWANAYIKTGPCDRCIEELLVEGDIELAGTYNP